MQLSYTSFFRDHGRLPLIIREHQMYERKKKDGSANKTVHRKETTPPSCCFMRVVLSRVPFHHRCYTTINLYQLARFSTLLKLRGTVGCRGRIHSYVWSTVCPLRKEIPPSGDKTTVLICSPRFISAFQMAGRGAGFITREGAINMVYTSSP